MKLKDFQKLDGWPETLDRFAEEASKITDCPELKKAGQDYLKEEENLIKTMAKFNVEIG